uniref:C-type mannose receptor 2-like n=1 Tax=Sinocyclocheilus rhinocerous TaxID=307959 RepID=A0A673LZD3_9TELE
MKFLNYNIRLITFLSLYLSATAQTDESDTFAFFHEGAQGCLGVRDHMLYLSSSCKGDAQLWKWVTRGRLFNIGSSLCLGITTGNVSTSGNKSPLGVFRCDYEPPRVRWTWSCSKFLETLESSLPSPKLLLDTGHCMYLSLSVFPGGNHEFLLEVRQLVFLCLFFSIEIYTIQGNSHGSPCYFPFLYDGQWFHSCTSVGREDGFHWCATTHDYGKDQRWGFCPVKSTDCETFWDINPLMDNCYQFNFQATLSWSETRTSCQQQGADLLSITKVEEQIFINGEIVFILFGTEELICISIRKEVFLSHGCVCVEEMPSYDEEENCGVISTDAQGRWHNRDCSVALPYICKKRPNATLDPFTTDDGRYQCDVGWQNFQAGCYRLNSDNLDWSSAHKMCQKMEANLVSIHTLPELEFITKHMKKEELWIGLHDTAMQMNFEWTDHTPVIFTYWHPFEPNNFRNVNEDCVTIWGPVSIYKYKYICAYVLVSRFEQAFVSSLVFGRSDDQFWLGLYNDNSTGTFRWITGEELTYTNWNRDEPAQIKAGCVVMVAGQAMGLWEVKDCASVRSKYICKQNQDSLIPSPPVPQPTPSLTGSCPSGWKSTNKFRYCYKVCLFVLC